MEVHCVLCEVRTESLYGKKLKCTLVQALRLCTGRTARRGSRGIALPFHDYGTRRGWGVSITPRPLFISGKDSVPIVQEAGWAPGPGWTGAENLALTGIRSPDRPSRSRSLYRLRPGRSLPPGKTRYPLYRRLDGPQGRAGQVRKISPPPGFDPRTFQPVAGRYTGYATRPTNLYMRCRLISVFA